MEKLRICASKYKGGRLIEGAVVRYPLHVRKILRATCFQSIIVGEKERWKSIRKNYQNVDEVLKRVGVDMNHHLFWTL